MDVLLLALALVVVVASRKKRAAAAPAPEPAGPLDFLPDQVAAGFEIGESLVEAIVGDSWDSTERHIAATRDNRDTAQALLDSGEFDGMIADAAPLDAFPGPMRAALDGEPAPGWEYTFGAEAKLYIFAHHWALAEERGVCYATGNVPVDDSLRTRAVARGVPFVELQAAGPASAVGDAELRLV